MNKPLLKSKTKEVIIHFDFFNFGILRQHQDGNALALSLRKSKETESLRMFYKIDVSKVENKIKEVFNGYLLDSEDKKILYTDLLSYFELCKQQFPLKSFIGFEENELKKYIEKNLKLINELIDYCKEAILESSSGSLTKTKNTKVNGNKPLEKIKLELNQTQIIYLVKLLIEHKIINQNANPKIWNLVSQYFKDKDGKDIKNIHQLKDKASNTKTGKPKRQSENIESVINKIKKGL